MRATMTMIFAAVLLASWLHHPCDALISTFFNMTIPTSFNYSNSDDERTEVNLGVHFFVTVPGTVTAVMFLKNNSATSDRVCMLHTSQGTQLARVSLPRANETGARQWQICQFAAPVAVMSDVQYVASIWTEGYLRSSGWFQQQSTTSGPLVLLGSNVNGRYEYGTNPIFPSRIFNANYWIDVRFETVTPTQSPTPSPRPTPAPTLTPAPTPTSMSSAATSAPPTSATTRRQTTTTLSSSSSSLSLQTPSNSNSIATMSTTLLPFSSPPESHLSTSRESVPETASINDSGVSTMSDSGMWIGIGVGLGAGFLALLLLTVWLVRRRRQNSAKAPDRPTSEARNSSKSEYSSLEMSSTQHREYASARAFGDESGQSAPGHSVYQSAFPANESNASTSTSTGQYQAIVAYR